MEEKKVSLSILGMTMGSGGAEKVISLLLPNLMNNYNVTLVLFFNVFHFEVPAGVKIEILVKKSNLSTIQKIFLFPVIFFRYLRFIKKNQIDLSISFLTRPNFINGLVKIFSKTRVIMSERNYPSIEYKSSRIRYLLYKAMIPALYSKADYLFSNSQWINKDLRENFNVDTNFEVIYNPVVLPERRKVSKGITDDNLVRFINVGRIFSTKNQQLIIDAVSNLKGNWHMSFLGDGVMKGSLEEKVKELNLSETIEFVGNVKNVNDYLLESDCFVLSSNSEGFPNALIEAMAVGLPVISTNCLSGPLEILNDNEDVIIKSGDFYLAKYGILINVGDEVALEKAMSYLIKEPRVLNELSNKSLERVEMYSVDNIFLQFNTLISRCLVR